MLKKCQMTLTMYLKTKNLAEQRDKNEKQKKW